MRVEASTVIKVAPQGIFEFIAAPENGPRWQEGAIATRVTTPGPVRIGSEIEHVGQWLGMRIPTHGTVTVFEPPSAFGYDIITTMSPSPSHMHYSLVPTAGGSLMTLSNDFDLPALMRPFFPVLRRSIQRMFERDVSRLRELLEANQPLGAPK